ncbi:hypothetical protein M9Y10_027685 [Tritrichomonas musculus]|uniref:AAA-ATPase-like domain-containing protein n=1 Tax=Tritrichomonas musculus TaxID=1915356 RepID=A0ABR2H4T2_9EUKA
MSHLPLFQEDFKQLRENCNIFYIDKTYFIKEWFESSYDKVSIILRPHHFGKTLNMSMIDYFFSNRYENSQSLFEDLFINNENHIMNHQAKYPVIFINFGDIETSDSNSIKNQIKMKIWQIYMIYKKQLMKSEKLDKTEKNFIDSISNQIEDDIAIHSIQYLCSFLSKIYDGQETIVLLDDYDRITVNNDGWKDVKFFYTNFIASTFKENKFLLRGLMTGVMNISLPYNVYNMTMNKYSSCFGFTQQEIEFLINFYKIQTNFFQIERWYGGYKFGDTEISNPYSICQFFNRQGQFAIYFLNATNNEIFLEFLKNASLNFIDGLIQLVQCKCIQKELNDGFVFNDHYGYQNEELAWIFLLSSGLLKLDSFFESINNYSKLNCTLKIQNKETFGFFLRFISEWFESRNYFLLDFIDALLNVNLEKMENFINSFINENFSFFNQSKNHPEIIYHAFFLGLATINPYLFNVMINNSNKSGCFWIILKPLDIEKFNSLFILYFKNQLLPESALDEINHDAIISDLENEGFKSESIKELKFSYSHENCKITFGKKEENALISNNNDNINADDENNSKNSDITELNKNNDDDIKEEKETEDKNGENNDISDENTPIMMNGTPDFDYPKSQKIYHKGEEVYVIDKNKFDIFKAVITHVHGQNKYVVHYPDFPQDDEIVNDRSRILSKTKTNNKIFREQEFIRNLKSENS